MVQKNKIILFLDTNMCDPWQTNEFIRKIFGGDAG